MSKIILEDNKLKKVTPYAETITEAATNIERLNVQSSSHAAAIQKHTKAKAEIDKEITAALVTARTVAVDASDLQALSDEEKKVVVRQGVKTAKDFPGDDWLKGEEPKK